MLKGFRDFILRGNVLDLAVAVVIGAAFGSIVTSLVKDIITPLIGAIGDQPDFSSLKVTVNGSQFLIGDFLNALISFALIAGVIYFLVVVPMNKVMAQMKKGEKVAEDTRVCPECLSLVPAKARICKFCTATLTS